LAKPQSKDDALEALDFIVNVLKEHEKDLDKLISELATVTEQMGDTTELNEKVESVEEKITGLQQQISSLVSAMSGVNHAALPAVKDKQPAEAPATLMPQTGHAVHLKVNQWQDFQSVAQKAQTVSFSYNEQEKILHADALRGNQIIIYTGALPQLSAVLKVYLSKQLEVPEKNILEGLLTVG
jgi:uncharacterized coiled-coil protein SlyX